MKLETFQDLPPGRDPAATTYGKLVLQPCDPLPT